MTAAEAPVFRRDGGYEFAQSLNCLHDADVLCFIRDIGGVYVACRRNRPEPTFRGEHDDAADIGRRRHFAGACHFDQSIAR